MPSMEDPDTGNPVGHHCSTGFFIIRNKAFFRNSGSALNDLMMNLQIE
jgi:hypothetical protein